MERHKPGDRPALTYQQYGDDVELPQTVGFVDADGHHFVVSLETAIAEGWIEEGEIERQSIPLEGAWRRLKKGV